MNAELTSKKHTPVEGPKTMMITILMEKKIKKVNFKEMTQV